ncbi:D-lactate dehydrogenase mitochondrial precursor [Polyplosphaeria fusca]|uniref:D-lactate dehydrogenase (cytochrome) n=1 Tax=Polyplosphaeria fusca TaxID=682080 RepID=A0A9P4RD10_9PLEO|nr:D-lactate dehydrogenase mitochondrial precursor [Polyplosphaeria fusca]
MFRFPAARLRQLASPLLRRGAFRAQTNATEPTVKPKNGQIPFWTSGRVLLFTGLTGFTTYQYGSNDATPRFQFPWKTSSGPHYASKSDMEKAHLAISELQYALGSDSISTDDEDLLMHGYSEWSSINIDQLPVAVAYPKSTEEVSQIAKVCHKYKVPMIPYSGGSSLEANFSAPYGGMSIDFSFMDQILSLHADDMDVVVQPSVPWMSLNEQIKDSGLFFPVDPGPSARIGGMVGTSCSGTNAVRYGTMKDWVINLTVVLADGTIIKTRRRPRKSSAGYNLTNLFIGSEGTLGLVTEITLKLAVVPQETSVAVVTFPSIREAAAAAAKVMRAGIPVAAMEIMDEVQMAVINRAGSTAKKWKEVPTMFFKFSGTKAGVHESVKLVRSIARTHNSGDFEFAIDAEEQKTLWSARKESLWSMLALREEGHDVWSTDVAVPLSRLPDIIVEISKKELDDLGLFASILGHIGDGNFHESIMYNSKDPKERAAVEKCIKDMVDRALEMEGTCTGEHGIGLGKKDSLFKELGLDTINVMKSIKGALDPLWLMNPGKIIDLPT